ncbi:efflux RND transporter periplasmic adaptor subunit [Alteromonas sp. ASW11-19]|uniref:Efflux RND transporter periplasmic adaptor subunit n=1 Tax=Alteromonas salexigens TaxID=2982530 RepID=A0ABT2VR19_9ALTE|nr:efflux RND transporter periplasmic adaptor subunit [Alteromonas salexigens]MCU7555332.1 efflux RND transporter periplasmic adaptor subunit [Alteromonas salexigens]
MTKLKIALYQATGVLLFALTTNFSVLAQVAAQPAPLVELDEVTQEVIAQQVWVPGTVVSLNDASIASEVAGRVIWLADVGTQVAQGDPLARLDTTRLRLSLAQDKANIAKWEARVARLESRVGRFTAMAETNNVSAEQLDETQAELEVARQELSQAIGSQALTEYQIAHSVVRAPFNALVVSRLRSPGEYTGVGEELVHIVDPTRVEAAIRAPLTVIPYLERGMSVTVTDQLHTRRQPVRTLVPVGNANSRMMEIRVSLAAGDFAIGSAVRVALPHSDAHEGLTVPRDALVLRKTGAFIYQINEQDEARQVPVITGVGVGERIEVTGDLRTGQPVIVRGAERLRPGQKVRYATQDTSLTAQHL